MRRRSRAPARRLALGLALSLAFTLAPAALAVAQEAASEASWSERLAERVHAMRLPDEPWQAIGWRTDLAVARREAAATGRPVFLWAMNGNPLGCT